MWSLAVLLAIVGIPWHKEASLQSWPLPSDAILFAYVSPNFPILLRH